VSITLTTAQAAALARVASEYESPMLQLHHVGKDPDLFVTTSGQGEPDLRIYEDGRVESLAVGSKPRSF
jgi:hypothetical protein